MPRSRRVRSLHQDQAPKPRAASGSGQTGASYLEVLVTLLLLALVVGALIPILTTGQQGYDEVRRRQEMIQNARVAMDKILRELRAAESYRALGSSLLRFTLFWGDGTGAAPTAEYSFNSVTNELEYRWKDDWDYRKQITVAAADAVAVDYSVALTLNHAALVSAGKSLASGDDVRVRYWNGSRMIELDRVVDPTSAWNGPTTTIWFRVQAPLAAAQEDTNYYLYYGNLSPGSPPANGDNVFLDYEDGTSLDGWTRRDALSGTYNSSPADGFIFQTSSINGFRELTKNVVHGNVEIFWGFKSESSGNNTRQAGMSARLSNTGAGYRVTPGDGGANNQLRIRFWSTWGAGGGVLGGPSAGVTISPGLDYFGRFYLVGSSIRAKVWQAGSVEPGWLITRTDTGASTGDHYGQVDGETSPQDHRHRTLIIRPRVPNEPALTLDAEVAGTRADVLAALAGPFRSMTVSCFDVNGNSVGCSTTSAVRSVQVELVAMDPSGRVPDETVTGRAHRQMP